MQSYEVYLDEEKKIKADMLPVLVIITLLETGKMDTMFTTNNDNVDLLEFISTSKRVLPESAWIGIGLNALDNLNVEDRRGVLKSLKSFPNVWYVNRMREILSGTR